MKEAAAHFMVSMRLRFEQLLHHGEERPVHGENLVDVGEQNLGGRVGGNGTKTK